MWSAGGYRFLDFDEIENYNAEHLVIMGFATEIYYIGVIYSAAFFSE